MKTVEYISEKIFSLSEPWKVLFLMSFILERNCKIICHYIWKIRQGYQIKNRNPQCSKVFHYLCFQFKSYSKMVNIMKTTTNKDQPDHIG